MNAADYDRKLQDFDANIWQPQFDFNEARGSDKPLNDFLTILKMHNNRGDICFAPIEFDMQLLDLAAESQSQCLKAQTPQERAALQKRITLINNIRTTLSGMFTVVDEAPVVKDVTNEYNVKAGNERMYNKNRNDIGEQATKAIFKDCDVLLSGDICDSSYKEKMAGIAQNVFDEVFGAGKVTVPLGDASFKLTSSEDWRTHFNVSDDKITNGQLGLVATMLTSTAQEVSQKQLNWQYGFRKGDNKALAIVPYEANNKPTSVGTSYTNKEMTTMLTYLAIKKEKDDYFSDPSKISGILSFMANATELCQNYPEVFQADPPTALTQLMNLAIEILSAFQGQSMTQLDAAFDRYALASLDLNTEDPLAKELKGLMGQVTSDDDAFDHLIFKVITNTKESETCFNANTNEISMMRDEIQFSGTIDEGLLTAVDRLKGNYEKVKVPVKGLTGEHELKK